MRSKTENHIFVIEIKGILLLGAKPLATPIRPTYRNEKVSQFAMALIGLHLVFRRYFRFTWLCSRILVLLN